MNNPTFFQKLKKSFVIATVSLLSLSAVLGIFLILFPVSTPLIYFRVIGTTTTFGVFSLLIVSGISRLSSKSQLVKVLAWITLVTSLIATFLLVLQIWGAFDVHCAMLYDRTYESACYANWLIMTAVIMRVLWVCIVLAFATAINSRYLDYRADNAAIAIFRNGTILVNTLLGSIFTIFILFEFSIGEFFFKFTVIGGILLVLGLIVTPILVLAEKSRTQHIVRSSIQANEQSLRAKIEQEVRAKIAAEEQAKNADANSQSSADTSGDTKSPSA